LDEKSKVLAELKNTVSELLKAGFDKAKILEIIEKLMSKTK
jgi:DNA-binding transcriptional regulator YhcF (GntR family)